MIATVRLYESEGCTRVVVQLSQILGHSDQLYTKLPRGLRVWQYSNAVVVTGLAAAVSIYSSTESLCALKLN